MNYATSNAPKKISLAYACALYTDMAPVFDSIDGRTSQLWSYNSDDSVAEVSGDGYFTNGQHLGMTVGDVIFCKQNPLREAVALSVTKVVPGGAATAASNASLYLTDGAGTVRLVGPRATLIAVNEIDAGYFFHGYADNQILGDPAFFDMSMGNDLSPGADLTNAQMWATDRYVSTIKPVVGDTDSVLRGPNLNFGYNATGEKLIVWWMGYGTPEGATAAFMGDGSGTTPTTRGLRIRMRDDGGGDFAVYGSTFAFSVGSTGTVFDGTPHSFAFCLDGASSSYGLWADEVYQPAFGSTLSLLNNGIIMDTSNSVSTWNLGASSSAPGTTDGVVTHTRALVVIKLPASRGMPSVAQMTNVFRQLRRNPGQLINASAFAVL